MRLEMNLSLQMGDVELSHVVPKSAIGTTSGTRPRR